MSFETVNGGPDSSAGPDNAASDADFQELAGFFAAEEGDEGADLDDGAEGAESDQGADTGGTGEDQRSPYIPRSRFDEVNTRLQQAREELQGFQEVLSQAAGRQVTLDEVRAVLAGQGEGAAAAAAAQQTPAGAEQALPETAEEWLQEQGIDPYELSPFELTLARQQHETARTMQGLRQAQAAAVEQAQAATWRADLQALSADFPELGDPTFRDAVLNLYEARHGTAPNQARFRQEAERFRKSLETYSRNALAEAAKQQQQDAGRPQVGGGGGAPSPANDRKWITEGSDAEFDAGIRSFLKAGMKAARR